MHLPAVPQPPCPYPASLFILLAEAGVALAVDAVTEAVPQVFAAVVFIWVEQEGLSPLGQQF